MHVTPSEFRMLEQDGIVVRFALLGSMAFVLTEIPDRGSAGTPLEQMCARPHWGFVNAGELAVEIGGRRRIITPGHAFHVPAGGPEHRFQLRGAARIASFEPIDPALEARDATDVERGVPEIGHDGVGRAMVIPTKIAPLTEAAAIDARAWSMSSLVLTRARFGPGSGYTSSWCDAPHWGLVTSGRLAMEWEDDIEVLAAGDVYHCPGGPPGHRLEAADPASIIDLTPLDAFEPGRRISSWRERSARQARAGRSRDRVAVAGLG